MRSSSIPVGKLLATTIVFAIAGPVEANAQVVDLSGAWTFKVTTDAGIAYPEVMLEQDGESLTGRYSSEALGESRVSGSVLGSVMTFMFSADVGGQVVAVIYTGKVDEDGNIFGTVEVGGGLATAGFSAVRSDP